MSEPIMGDVQESTDNTSQDACDHKEWQVYEIKFRLAECKQVNTH